MVFCQTSLILLMCSQLVENSARLDYTRIDDVIESIQAFAVDSDELGVTKHGQMLRDISFADAEFFDHGLDWHLLLAQKI